jgi:hypothetical protein
MDFASWLTDIMARNRSTYVLGGQATLFRIKHLRQVTVDHERNSPWDPDAQVEDMELTWRLHEAGRKTLVSATARAYAGTMVTVKGLMGQRRKWDEGMAALLWKHKMPDKNTMIPWKQQFQMMSNGLVRLLFAIMLLLALTVHQFVWSPDDLADPHRHRCSAERQGRLAGAGSDAGRPGPRAAGDPGRAVVAVPDLVDNGVLAEHLVRRAARRLGRTGSGRVG